jgi:hypothetical protein
MHILKVNSIRGGADGLKILKTECFFAIAAISSASCEELFGVILVSYECSWMGGCFCNVPNNDKVHIYGKLALS